MRRLLLILVIGFIHASLHAITVTATVTPTACTPCNGSITATASAGTAPYQYSIDGGVTWQSSGLFSGLCAATYTITAKDALNATASVNATVVQNPPLSFTLSGVNCSNMTTCNGQIIVTITGGVPPYTIHVVGPVSGFYTSSPITNRCPGTYTVTVVDASNNCGFGYSPPQTITITGGAPAGPGGLCCMAYLQVGQCQLVCDNTLIMSASGGTPPYQFSVNGGPYSSATSAPNMCEGPNTYTVCVRDAALNTWCGTAYLPTNFPYSRMIPSTTASGCSSCTGTITFAQPAMSGEQFYLYTSSMTLLAQNTTGIFTGVCAGTYNVQCYYQGCWNMFSVTVTSSPTFTVNFTSTLPTCYGGCNGAITCTPNPFSPTGYQYSKDNGVTWQSSNTFTGLCAGTFNLRVKDSLNCYGMYSYTLSNPAQLPLTVSPIYANCLNGNCLGGFILNPATGPNAPYQWTTNGGTTWQSSNQFLNYCSGNYQVGVRDTLGCMRLANYSLPSNLYQYYLGNLHGNPTCANPCGGYINLTLGSSNAPVAYNLYSIDSGITWQTGLGFSNLCAGTYHAQAKNTLTGCYSPFLTIVLAPASTLAISASSPQPACPSSCNGTMQATITSAANPPYQYSKDGGVIWQSSSLFTGMCVGTYTITVKNSLNCTATQTVVVNSAPVVSASATSSDPVCYGDCNGTLTVSASSTPTQSFQYSINGGVTWYASNLFSGLCAGAVNVQVKDSYNCITNTAVTLTNPSPVIASISATPPLCSDVCNGSIVLNPTQPSGYSYSIDSGLTWQSATNYSGLCAGLYTVIIHDAVGCNSDSTFTFIAPPPITASTNVTSISCTNMCDGAITLNASPVGSYSYSLDSGLTWQSSNAFANLCAGQYDFMVRDSNLCSAYGTEILIAPLPVAANSNVTSISCANMCDGGISINATPSGTYSYSLDSGLTWQSSNAFANLCAGQYDYMVRDSNLCSAYGTEILTAPLPVVATLSSQVNATCYGDCNGSLTLGVSPSGTYQFSIDSAQNWQSGNQFTNLCAGNYAMMVENVNGCRDTVNVSISEPDAINIQYFTSDVLCYNGTDGSVILTSMATSEQYSLDSGLTWSTDTAYYNLAAGSYNVVLTDGNGCTATTSFVLTQPPILSVSTACTFPSYCGCSGQMTPYGVGGVPSYTYTITPVNQQFGLCVGTYTVTTTDENGCTAAAPFTIYQALPLQIDSIVSTPAIAPNNDGTATVYFSGGYMVYNVSWDAGTGFQQWSTATNLAPGTYCVTVADGMGCQDTACVTVGVITDSNPLALVDYSVYPNPANNLFVVKGLSGEMNVQLYDASGRVVQNYGAVRMNDDGQTFALPQELADGNYILEMTYGDAVFREKIAVVR